MALLLRSLTVPPMIVWPSAAIATDSSTAPNGPPTDSRSQKSTHQPTHGSEQEWQQLLSRSGCRLMIKVWQVRERGSFAEGTFVLCLLLAHESTNRATATLIEPVEENRSTVAVVSKIGRRVRLASDHDFRK